MRLIIVLDIAENVFRSLLWSQARVTADRQLLWPNLKKVIIVSTHSAYSGHLADAADCVAALLRDLAPAISAPFQQR